MSQNAYDFEFTAINGKSKIKLADYKGKLTLIINTASLCRFTKQFAEIEALHQKYKDSGLIIIAVPSNNFGNQEPANNEKIAEFCAINFNNSFMLTTKTDVIGQNCHPFFKWIRESLGWFAGPKWNFYKFLIGTDGQPLEWFSSLTTPVDKKILNIIDKNLLKVSSHD